MQVETTTKMKKWQTMTTMKRNSTISARDIPLYGAETDASLFTGILMTKTCLTRSGDPRRSC